MSIYSKRAIFDKNLVAMECRWIYKI